MAGHLKRIAAPRAWKIKRKISKWILRPYPGAHSYTEGFALGTFLVEKMKGAKTQKEARIVLRRKHVLVNGVRRTNTHFLVGCMDLIEIPETKEVYRLVYDQNGYLKAVKETQKVKPSRIKHKTMHKGKMVLHLSDGRNIPTDKKEYKVNDTVILDVPSMKITTHLPLQEGMLAYLVGGSHVGEAGTINQIKGNTVEIKTDKETFETTKKSVFVIGKDKPTITLQ